MPTITRVYDAFDQAQRAVSDLEAAGVPSSDISLISNHQAQYAEAESGAGGGAGVGALLGGGAGLLAGLGMIAIPGIGPVVAVGWLAATALGVAAGATTGGIVGALIGSGVSEPDAHVYAESVRRGGAMVSVRASDENTSEVTGILDTHYPVDASVRGVEYRSSGWTEFDPAAEPYTLTDAERDRLRRRDRA
jgi:hypothetical protein